MNFLEIAQAVRILSGTQGTGPASVSTVSGYEVALVDFIKSAWIDIQNYRDEWDFLKSSKTFNTVISQDTYTPVQIFGISPDLKKWDKSSLVITDAGRKYKLKYVELDVLEDRYLNNVSESRPTVFSIDVNNNLVLKNIPGAIYTVEAKYWKNPQRLLIDTDIPLCNSSFHDLIVYKALEKMSIYLSSPEIFRNYSVEAARMLAQMMRLSNPKKVMKTKRPFA